ncbi:hypothetical protein K439DRAFT_1621298 [Ramaria rubella]|nr:hypothetical protein K439DRAFT_1621298 [Ramaria rubella]
MKTRKRNIPNFSLSVQLQNPSKAAAAPKACTSLDAFDNKCDPKSCKSHKPASQSHADLFNRPLTDSEDSPLINGDDSGIQWAWGTDNHQATVQHDGGKFIEDNSQVDGQDDNQSDTPKVIQESNKGSDFEDLGKPSVSQEVTTRQHRDPTSRDSEITHLKLTLIAHVTETMDSYNVLDVHRKKKKTKTGSLPSPTALRAQIAETRANKVKADNVLHHAAGKRKTSKGGLPMSIPKTTARPKGMRTLSRTSTSTPSATPGPSASTPSVSTPSSSFVSPPAKKTVAVGGGGNGSGLIKGAEGNPAQAQSYTPGHRSMLALAKRYMHLFIATQDAFPDLATMRNFVVNAIQLTSKDMEITVERTVGNDKMMREQITKAMIVSAGFAAKDSIARLQSKILNLMPLEIIAFASMAIHNALAEFVELGIRKNVNMHTNVYASKYCTYLKHIHTFSTSAKQVNCLDLQQFLYTTRMDKLEQNLDSSGSEEMFTLGDSLLAQSVA